MKTGFKTGRRQHRSCDQCRKGKRACDVAFAKEPGATSDDIAALGPCSNCKRTGKNCTLQWLRAVHRASLRPRPDFAAAAAADRPKLEDTPAPPPQPQPQPQPVAHAPAHRPQQQQQQQQRAAAYSYPYSPPVDDPVLQALLPPPAQLPAHNPNHNPNPADQWPSSGFDCLPLRAAQDPLDDDFHFDDIQRQDLPQPDYQPPAFPYAAPSTSSSGHSSSGNANGNGNGLYLPGGAAWECDDDESPESVEQAVEDAFAETPTDLMAFGRPARFSQSQSQSQGARSPSAASFSSFLEHLQPSHLQSRLSSSMNQSVLTKGLWKVYHDSFENALSCWLTEKTCPYTYKMLPAAGDAAGCESLSEVWGPSWGNRIVGRVCHLDMSWSKLRNRPVPQAEDRAASRALQLSIMAFATQWAQGSQRSAAEYSFGGMDGSAFPLDGEFDRMLQESFWHQARRALQDAADCESFRVVLAHVIFSFTQKPLNLDQHADVNGETGCDDTSKLDDIIDSEGPPIFLEAATRQVFAHRAKLHRMMGRNGSASPVSKLESVDRKVCTKTVSQGSANSSKTFDMMFWLCVMFDTLSAVMNDRPLVVSDKDSKIHPDRPKNNGQAGHNGFSAHSTGDLFTDGAFSPTLPEEPQSDLWGDLFLKTKPIRWNQGIPRWPCSYEEAATTLCNAAPVKVLLYRKVARLQTLMSRVTTKPEKMEASITESIKVYQHWNHTYGQFFVDCINDHDNLPARIQSWYVILSGHWHLAALSLADMIQRIDEGGMGMEAQQKHREQSRLCIMLRKENAFAVSDLGRVSSPNVDSSFAKAREFHFAVNKGALLTEPWTVVLVRSFAKAARVLLDSVPVPSQLPPGSIPVNMNAANEYMRRCEHCIKALWYLGRKSDMAYLAATFLSNSLKAKATKLSPRQSNAAPRRPTMDSNFYNPWQGWENGHMDTSVYASL
ncbi:putative C6 transcription factor protein [Neofusicoccum parvum]|uniref:C6 transcription factor protein n=1 Tax=Neofusicoccum parvum TaxID=310453 RepID=A0ACB5RZ65_9PEZI|nr:putative C6 transcription factor protein [Neofusicoccum parvum]